MSGFHIHCGAWQGSDKSGDAFPEVVRDVQRFVAPEEDRAWRDELMAPLRAQEQSAVDDYSIRLELSPRMVAVLLAPLRRYSAWLAERRGLSPPRQARALRPGRAADGCRWRCAQDLLEACEVCNQTGSPVVVFWS